MLKSNLAAAAIALFAAVALQPAPAKAADTLKAPTAPITIEGKKPVVFSHQIHLGLGVTCGQCHHDANHQPRTAENIGALKSGEELKCVTCHNETFAKADLRERKQIFHARCRECHQAGVNGKKGPTNCTACHGKSQKKAVEGC